MRQETIPLKPLIVRFVSNDFPQVLPVGYVELAFLERFRVRTTVDHSVPEVLNRSLFKEDMINIFRELRTMLAKIGYIHTKYVEIQIGFKPL